MITKYLISFFAVASTSFNVLCNKDAPQLQERRKKNVFSVFFLDIILLARLLYMKKSMLVMLENVCLCMQGLKEK